MARDGRTIGELLVLIIAGTVCVVVVITTVALGVIEVLDPETDTSAVSGAIANVISTLVGLMAGFLAGRTDRRDRNGDQ